MRVRRRPDDARRAELVGEWRRRARELELYARRRRDVGHVHGPESAQDAEAAALEYRLAADELEAELEELDDWNPLRPDDPNDPPR